jgi:hypothetical protein
VRASHPKRSKRTRGEAIAGPRNWRWPPHSPPLRQLVLHLTARRGRSPRLGPALRYPRLRVRAAIASCLPRSLRNMQRSTSAKRSRTTQRPLLSGARPSSTLCYVRRWRSIFGSRATQGAPLAPVRELVDLLAVSAGISKAMEATRVLGEDLSASSGFRSAGAKRACIRTAKPRCCRTEHGRLSRSLASIAQRLDDEAERRRGLPAARIKEVVARKWKAPILQYALKTAFGDMRLRHALRQVGKARAR